MSDYVPYPDDHDLKGELIQYSHDVLGGQVVACQKHKWACQRFLDDLAREDTDDFPYVFDEAKAIRFLNWMKLFPHTKGPLAGTLKDPAPIEMFIFGNIYGWVHRETGYRRFRQAYWQVGRKNAKSQDLAIVGLYEMAGMKEASAEVYVAATKKDQTRFVWDEADAIYRRSDLRDAFKTAYGVIKHPKSNSYFARLTEEDKKKGDGSNPQCGILDEYHAHETDEYYNVLSSGMKTRTQPLLIIITTAGFDLKNPCYRDEYDYISKILNPDVPIDNDRYFAMVNELDKDPEGNLIDNIADEACWIKANPILATTKEGMEAIRAELKVAQDKPEKMRDFLTKTLDVWVNMRSSGYMQMDKWALCKSGEGNQFPDVSGLQVTAGLDLSSTIDLTSVSFEVTLPDGRFAVMSHSFMPEDTLEEKRKTDKAPYDRWIKQGWITATPGAQVDYHAVLDYIVQTYETYGWAKGEVCFDRYHASWLTQELAKLGFIPVDIPQQIPALTEPTKDFRAKVYNKKVIHDNNEVLTWAMSNAVARIDYNRNIMLDKSKSSDRIDPAAALMNAHVRAMGLVPEKVDVSEFADEEFLKKLWGGS